MASSGGSLSGRARAPAYCMRSSLLHAGSTRAPRTAAAVASGVATVASSGVSVTWRLHHHCDFGQHVAIVGGHKLLGDWLPDKAVQLTWTDGDEWVGEATFGGGLRLEYKYVVRSAGGELCYWRPGSNVKLEVPTMPGARLRVLDNWNNDVERMIEVHTTSSMAQPQAASSTYIPAPAAAAPAPGPQVPQAALPVEDPLSQVMAASMTELREVMRIHGEIQKRAADPTAAEVLQADRVLAAASNKAVAMGRALKAAKAFPQLPRKTSASE